MSLFRSRDKRIADDSVEGRGLMCHAHGCPLEWCVDMGSGRLCGNHDRAPAREWPAVTQWLLDREAERAIKAAAYQPEPVVKPIHIEERRAILRKMADTLRRMSSKADLLSGARSLRNREDAGESLTQAQRQFWRQALRVRDVRAEE